MQNGLILPRDVNIQKPSLERKIKDSEKLMNDILSSVDISKDEYPLVEEALNKWLVDESYFEKYSKWRIIKPGTVIVRVFRYESTARNGLLKPDGEPYSSYKILSLGKIIKAHPFLYGDVKSNLKTGDVVGLSESITSIIINNDWLKWNDIMNKERPQPNIPEPDKFGGELSRWNASKFICDKMNPVEDDNWTFIRNESDFSIAYDI